MARCGEVVGIDDHIGRLDQRLQPCAFDALLDGDDLRFRVDARERRARRLDLRLPDRGGVVRDLPLQVGEIDLVVIAQCDAPHPAGSQIQRDG
jgi:hypothetical protein